MSVLASVLLPGSRRLLELAVLKGLPRSVIKVGSIPWYRANNPSTAAHYELAQHQQETRSKSISIGVKGSLWLILQFYAARSYADGSELL